MSCVYFIQCGAHVKIGVATDLGLRLSAIQIGSPEAMRVLAVIENAGLEKERELHARFASLRVRGEWFSVEGALADYLAALPAYDRATDPQETARRFLSKHIKRVHRADRFLKGGALFRRYSEWCALERLNPLNEAAATRLFREWFSQRSYLITGGTVLRPRWAVFGAGFTQQGARRRETTSDVSC